jgi:hypothetical protein
MTDNLTHEPPAQHDTTGPQVVACKAPGNAANEQHGRGGEISADHAQVPRGMSVRFAMPTAAGRGYEGNCFQRPSETTSTVPSVILMAVWSSMAYAGPAISAAHLSASAMVFSGMSS